MILNGLELREKLKSELKEKVSNLEGQPKLRIIMVGNNPASELYVSNKIKFSAEVGIDAEVINYDESITEEELIAKIGELNIDPEIDGLFVQLPVPKHISEDAIIHAIKPEKDVDGFTHSNLGKILVGYDKGLAPCTPSAVMQILENYNIEVNGADVVIIGRSNIVGKPLALMLINKGATVTVCNSRTKDLAHKSSQADILISATGQAHMVDETFVKEGAVVVDVGIAKLDGKTVGDVNFDVVKDKTKAITPVPGGIGPLTVYNVINNTYNSYVNRRQGDEK